jgi:hypothetical protein
MFFGGMVCFVKPLLLIFQFFFLILEIEIGHNLIGLQRAFS